ncbi:MAG: GFA family protein [Caulobacteraceae bacterium]|nr:GFA family protein [Caulobacteraceae bacterium]
MIRGSCLCGQVGYECGSLSGPIVHCHCRTCQKAQASAFNTSARTLRVGFGWTQGEDGLVAFASSPGKLRWFCKACGAHLLSEWIDRPEVVLRIATVDEGLGSVRPQAHIWVSHLPEWDVLPEDALPRYAEGME